jgi:hypothetical protein
MCSIQRQVKETMFWEVLLDQKYMWIYIQFKDKEKELIERENCISLEYKHITIHFKSVFNPYPANVEKRVSS